MDPDATFTFPESATPVQLANEVKQQLRAGATHCDLEKMDDGTWELWVWF